MSDGATPQHTHIESNSAYETALDTLIGKATRRLRIFDRTLGRTFDTPQRYERLRHFLLAHRTNRLQIVLHDAQNVPRDCPRLARLLRDFSHAISMHETLPEAHGVYDPFTIADDRHFAHRFHYEDARGLLALDDPHGAGSFVERFTEIFDASFPAVAPTTLGL